MEAIECFELTTGWLLDACMISMKVGSDLIKVLDLTDAPVTLYKKSKLRNYFEHKQKLVATEYFTNQNEPKTLATFQMGKDSNLGGSTLNNQRKKKLQVLFMKHPQVFSRNKNDLGYCDKIKQQIKLNKDAQPLRNNYCCMSFDGKTAIKKLSKI